MKEFVRKNKIKLFVVVLGILFSAYIINGIREHSIIPDHIHSIDDKAPEERTDSDNITILERSLNKDPENIAIMIELAGLYIKTDNEKPAKKMLNKIIEIDPYNKEAIEKLKQLD